MLKARSVALVLAFLFAGGVAEAGTLVTGEVRDQAGSALSGARVTAIDAGGRVVGSDVAIADGTFALDLNGLAVTLEVACDYCVTRRLALAPADRTVVVIVRRFVALTARGASADDARALPYRNAADLASLIPFSVVDAGRVSDRGLDFSGALFVNGLPFYSAANGDDFARLVPAHAAIEVTQASPLTAPVYGAYASAGSYDVVTAGPDASPARFDAGNGFDLVARATAPAGSTMYATSNDGGYRREAAAADVDVPSAGGRISIDALDMADDFTHASGVGLGYSTESRNTSTSASLRATQSNGASLVSFDAHVANHGPLALAFGLRAMRATATAVGDASAQADGAVYATASRRSGPTTISAQFAVDRGGDSGSAGVVRSQALVGSLNGDLRIDAHWSAHSGIVSNQRIPTFAETSAAAPGAIPANRSLLVEQSLTYTDLHRLRLTTIAYTQRTTGPATTHVNGIGIDAGWQIAPQWSLRGWLLRANASAFSVGYPAAYPGIDSRSAPVTRQLLWLSYDNGVRVDALVRGGALEGDVRVPLSSRYALMLGTARSELAPGAAPSSRARITTLGITSR